MRQEHSLVRSCIAIAVATLASCTAPEPRASEEGVGASQAQVGSRQCTPALLQVERREYLTVLSEGMTAGFFVAGCREDLVTLRPEEKAAAIAFLKEKAADHPRGYLRSCDTRGKDPTPPDAASLVGLNERVGRTVITDWCWDIWSIDGAS